MCYLLEININLRKSWLKLNLFSNMNEELNRKKYMKTWYASTWLTSLKSQKKTKETRTDWRNIFTSQLNLTLSLLHVFNTSTSNLLITRHNTYAINHLVIIREYIHTCTCTNTYTYTYTNTYTFCTHIFCTYVTHLLNL